MPVFNKHKVIRTGISILGDNCAVLDLLRIITGSTYHPDTAV